MNNVCLIGRLTRDPEVRVSNGANSTTVARFSLAVDRQFKNANGEREADFINCVAFGGNGEFAEKWLRKGMKVGVTGRIQTGSYENKEGKKVYTTDIIVNSFDFCDSANNSGGNTGNKSSKSNQKKVDNDFINVPDGVDEELPFN